MRKRNGIECPEAAVCRVSYAQIPVARWHADERMVGKSLRTTPCVSVIIFRSCSVVRWKCLTVDINFFIAFSPPSVNRILKSKAITYVPSRSGQLGVGKVLGRGMIVIPCFNARVLMPRCSEMETSVVPFPLGMRDFRLEGDVV